jgi:TolA-binding protein
MVKNKRFLILLAIWALIAVDASAFAAGEDVLKKVRVSFLREEYQEVTTECERLLLREHLDSNMQAELYYLAGVSFLKQNKFSKAKDNLLMLISRYARTEFVDDAYLSLGDCYLLSGDIDNALRSYRAFLSKYPQSDLLHLVYWRLAESYYRSGQWDKAGNYFKKVIEKYPKSFEADKAKALLDEGLYFTVQLGAFINKRNAKSLYERLIDKEYPAYVSSFNKKGKTFYRVRVGKFDSRKQAELVKKRLKKDGFSGQIYP